MRHKVAVVVVLIAATVVGTYILRGPAARDAPDSSAASLRQAEEQSVDGRPDEAASSVAPQSSSGVRAVPHPLPAVPKSRAGLPMDNDPFIAESIAEQRWLDRNGYPNADQWREYTVASDAVLEQASAAGDTVARAMLDSRALMRGDQDAMNRLMGAAEEGSAFAMALLSSYMASSPKGDPKFGYALSRVLEMRGDYRAAIGREGMFPRALSPAERTAAEADALVIMERLKANYRGRAFVDPRPRG